jgi:hypothetical protein
MISGVGSGAGNVADAGAAGPWGGHPVRRLALAFGLVNGVFAVLQVAVSSWAALVNRGVYISLYYGANGVGFNNDALLAWLLPIFTAAYGTCLLGFVVSLVLCWHAGRAAAAATGRRGAGAQVGALVALYGSVIWIVASVAAVLLVHTDATLAGVAGVLTAPKGTPGLNSATEIVVLLAQEIVAGLLAVGIGALAGRIGAGAAGLPRTGR